MIERTTADGITTLTLSRPEKLNALAGTMREDLLAGLRAAERDSECRAVIVTGAGRGFCSGGDVDFMRGLRKRGDAAGFRRLLDLGRDIVVQIAAMPKPVIAAVNGVAAGAGCNLALACDYRIASPEAKLGETFVRIGLHPDWGGTWLLPRLIGPSRALELMMTGRMVDAGEALEIGMIDRIAANAVTAARELGLSIAAAPAGVIADIKRALRASLTNGLASQIEIEIEHQVRAFSISG